MSFKPVAITGTRRQVGVALGKLARPLMSAYLDQSTTWRTLRPWRGHVYLQELAGNIQHYLPELWEEFEGMAEGLRLPADDLLLWNCRGDLLHQTTDGCTSITIQGAEGVRWIAHNEDGDPYLYGRCPIVDVRPDDAPGYVSFYYPGSLPGHTFAANRSGIVQTINNLRTRARRTGVPRMFLARAVLDCETLDQAVELLRDTPRAGSFHHMLGASGDERLFSIEAMPGLCSMKPIARRYGHANHMIHDASQDVAQIITDSSRARQTRVDGLLDGWHSGADETHIVAALHDTDGPLPILRCAANDPDEENTLATAVFELDDEHVNLRIYDRKKTVAQRIAIK
ncbi:C45 family autoproteolytic acyltransferase/hydolase [Bordetella tumulicola]|uniref:C45 family autoproteolytic acyltransferase/hydolase n=1 Tax=Bordetella tumulicola TaxID=1649133 RepID=UPI0039F05B33